MVGDNAFHYLDMAGANGDAELRGNRDIRLRSTGRHSEVMCANVGDGCTPLT